MTMATVEQWRSHASFPNYEVSSLGRVRRCPYRMHHSSIGVLNVKAHPTGYYRAGLWHDGKLKWWLVHRMVALAFIGEAPSQERRFVAHWDGDKSNNRVGNLRWATQSENGRDQIRLGRTSLGERNGWAKLTDAEVREIASLKREGKPSMALAKQYGVSTVHVDRIMRGECRRSAFDAEV